MATSPTAFISYSHDSPEHEARVLRLSERLRADGVECTIDAYEVSPPQGWPTWMRRQVQESDFCIVVCTGTYGRRFAGDEASGTGKGSTWEGGLLRQVLYDEGKNDRVIPVVFGEADIRHIPLELRGATYYDLSSDAGYGRLHRALTGQPLVERSPVRPVRRHLPLLQAQESDTMALLAACPDPLPVDVIAHACAIPIAAIDATLSRLVDRRFVGRDGASISLPNRSLEGLPSLTAPLAGLALEAALDFIQQHHREPAARAQLDNAIALLRGADVHPPHATYRARSQFCIRC